MSRLTLSLVQADLAWENKKANLEAFTKKIESLSGKTQLVILPEMFNTGFSMNAEALAEDMSGETVAWMREMAAKHKLIITGSLIIKENNNYYNRLVWMLPNGQQAHYDKRHLFAYAGENESFSGGDKRLIASVNGWKINLIVCYDLRFPVWARQQFTEEGFEYDLIICVANWPERRVHAWKTLLQARAIENQCFVVGVNRVGKDGNQHQYSGSSLVADPLGEVLWQKENEEAVFTITLEKDQLNNVREKLPFWKDADPFIIPMPVTDPE
jgi:predicted amidohydrolase